MILLIAFFKAIYVFPWSSVPTVSGLKACGELDRGTETVDISNVS